MDSLMYMFPISSPWFQDDEVLDSSSKLSTSLAVKKTFSSPNIKNNSIVLYGSPNGGKTSLLFQAAVSYAAKELYVIYICPQPFSRVPLGVHGMPKPQANVLNNVKFMYINNTRELLNYCATAHTRSLLPDALIVDDFDFYIEQENKEHQNGAKLCAFLTDTVCYINSKLEHGHCQLLLGSRDCSPALPAVFNKFSIIPAFITRSLQGENYTVQVKVDDLDMTIIFNIKSTGIFLHTIDITRR